jgi:hypothetical protein
VAGDVREVRALATFEERVDGASRGGVDASLLGRWHAGKHGCVDQRVREPIVASPIAGDHKPRGRGLLERLEQREHGLVEDLGDDTDGEAVAGDGSGAEKILGGGRDLGHPEGRHFEHPRRYGVLVLCEGSTDLPHEERVTTGLKVDVSGLLSGGGKAGDGKQIADRLRPEAAQGDALDLGVGRQCFGDPDPAVAVGGDDEQPHAPKLAANVDQQSHRRVVCPLEIIEHEDQAMLLRSISEATTKLGE